MVRQAAIAGGGVNERFRTIRDLLPLSIQKAQDLTAIARLPAGVEELGRQTMTIRNGLLVLGVFACSAAGVCSLEAASFEDWLAKTMTPVLNEIREGDPSPQVDDLVLYPPGHSLSHLSANSFRSKIAEILTKGGIAVKPNAPVQLRVDYSKASFDPETGNLRQLPLLIEVKKNDTVLCQLQAILEDKKTLLALHQPIPGDGPIRDLALAVATRIATYFDQSPKAEEGKIAVQVGSFSSPRGNDLRIRLEIERALEVVAPRLELVKTGARYTIHGSVGINWGDDAQENQIQGFCNLTLRVEIRDALNNPVENFRESTSTNPLKHPSGKDDPANTEVLIHRGGSSCVLRPDDNLIEIQQQLIDATVHSRAVINGNTAYCGRDPVTGKLSPYGIELEVVGREDATLQLHRGQPFVDVARGERYRIWLINDSDYDAAARLTMDGLALFTFSEEDYRQYTHVIVSARSRTVIPGWHLNNTTSREFLVGSLAESEVRRILPESLDLSQIAGTVTASFRAAWEEGAKSPDDEPAPGTLGAGNATRLGPKIQQNYQPVQRILGALRGCVSIRYSETEAPASP